MTQIELDVLNVIRTEMPDISVKMKGLCDQLMLANELKMIKLGLETFGGETAEYKKCKDRLRTLVSLTIRES